MEKEKKSVSIDRLNNEDFKKIKNGLKKKINVISNLLNNKVDNGNWGLKEIDFKVNDGKEVIDLVFYSPDKKKGKYILVDISVPHLQIGQTYALPAKTKSFHKEQKVALTRIKKAIVLVRKGTETLSTRPSRIRCPILEVQLKDIVAPEKKQPEKNVEKKRDNNQKNNVSPELLNALKSAIVHESLSTMNKRENKYVRRGLWKWIEREIMDPNVHFYLIILSGIYQGRTGDILSRKFKTAEEYSSKPEDVISSLFSRDNNLADEIKKNSARHKKALKKFLACFSQTPPFEYLRSLFLKEFRSGGDSLKARMTVYSTLRQLLERCGFEGEKEVFYPLEILDELAIFQGIMAGDYSELRINNATKKLKRLVPQVPWNEEAVYNLRNQLAKILKLPSQEFNLNAFLPQAFNLDAKQLVESRIETVKRVEPVQFRSDDRNSDKSRLNQNNVKKTTDVASEQKEKGFQRESEVEKNRPQKQVRENNRDKKDNSRTRIYDEGIHRFFENYGGHIEEDTDAIRLALAMDRYEIERLARLEAKKNAIQPTEQDLDDADKFVPPIKKKHAPRQVLSVPPVKKRSNNSGQRSGSIKKTPNRAPSRSSSKRTPGNKKKR